MVKGIEGVGLDLPKVGKGRGVVRRERVGGEVVIRGFHPSQLLVVKDSSRFKVLACGRRWGKTRLAAALAFEVALRGGRSWWVAPSYPLSRVGWRLFKRMAAALEETGVVRVREAERMVEVMSGGGWVQVRSGHDAGGLVSEGLDFVVLDECALMKEEVWEISIRPSLADRLGRAVFISTPRGINWFHGLYMKGQGREDGWASWSFPTWDNPYIDKEEIEAARRELPDRVFRQEFGAEFIESDGNVFRNVMGCVDDEEAKLVRDGGGPFVFGVDWGRVRDYTVVVVVDSVRGVVVEVARWGGMEYGRQLELLWELHDRYRPVVVVAEANSMGGPLVEQIRRDGMVVIPVWMDRGRKAGMVERLRLAFEREEIVIPDDKVLVGELLAYEEEELRGGGYRYSAPDGGHDDTVVALMLAWSMVGRTGDGVDSLGDVNRVWGGEVDLVREGGRLYFRPRVPIIEGLHFV